MKPIVVVQHEADDPPGSIGVALRDLGVPFEVRRVHEGDALPVWPHEASALISLGGAMHVTQAQEHPFLAEEVVLMRRLLREGAPLWGICLGAQLLTVAAGGEVYRRDKAEVGWYDITIVADDPILHGVGSPFVAFEWHEYSCTLPARARLVAERPDGVQVFRAGGRAWATQFHPEVDEAMAPHWVRDAVKEHPEQGADFFRRLRDDTEDHLPSYPAFCARLVRNFLLASGLLPADR